MPPFPRLSARSLNNKGLLLQTESAGHGPALPKVARGGIESAGHGPALPKVTRGGIESAGHGPALPKVARGGIAGPCPASA